MLRPLGLVALLAAVALPGCLSDLMDDASNGGDSFGLEPFVNPIDLDHDHGELALHEFSNNIDLVGHTYMGDNGPPGGLGEIDTAGDYAYVAVFNHGFAIIDLVDPTNPQMVSLFEIPVPTANPFGRYTADLKVDASGDWVFLAMELSEEPGVLIVDARDRAEPKLAGFWPQPGLLAGCHMIEYAVISEQEYLFCAPLDNAVYVGLILPEAGGTREIQTVARWVPNSPGYVESELGHLTDDPQGFPNRYVISGHQDMTYQPDPLTGAPTLFVSFWNLGLRIVDVSIPAVPIEIGFWDGVGADGYRGNFHTAMAFESQGRRIAVAIPEGPDPPAIFILDATDYANPIVLSEWSALPSFTDSEGNNHAGSFSLHNFQVVGGKIYIAMGHGGLWVIDVSTPEKQSEPEAVGSYYPHMPRPDGEDYSIYPWDVNLYKGYMLDGEGNGGFYVLHFRGDPAGDETFNGFA
ncbi:MAG: LVIVD repeat-containing protein [Thermoplasmatota archaeon]